MLIINEERLLKRIHTLGAVGLDADGRRTRLAASDEDKAGRDLVSRWMSEAGLTVVTDYIGNLFGIWVPEGCADAAPLMLGSHIDTVINAGQFDGCYGVLAALEVVETLKASGFVPARPIAIGAFTNEEGVRYAPDMMGSLVYAGGYPLEKALASVGTDGTVLGEELRRIGYAGTVEPGFLKPCAFVELHIEQGPILDAEGISIGAVENLQGISWQRVTIEGEQNHAGTTPTAYRVDAGLAAAKVITFLRRRCELPSMSFRPGLCSPWTSATPTRSSSAPRSRRLPTILRSWKGPPASRSQPSGSAVLIRYSSTRGSCGSSKAPPPRGGFPAAA